MEENLKQLLLKDLCARLPYGVKCYIEFDDGKIFKERTLTPMMIQDFKKSFMLFKPYLRPMSSMTEEEDKEWQLYKSRIAESCDELLEKRISELHDWFCKKHLDYHGLIPMGLALEALEGMYK